MTEYKFKPGQRVRHRSHSELGIGTVTTCVPGNGSVEWYFVHWNGNGEDRYTSDDLVLAN